MEKLREQRNYFHEEKWTELGLEKKQELAEARDFARYDLEIIYVAKDLLD